MREARPVGQGGGVVGGLGVRPFRIRAVRILAAHALHDARHDDAGLVQQVHRNGHDMCIVA